ncbi:hypothetical protein [Streptomyces sp. NPDC016845]|uniref:hypothetical protein n=1 Tax=Streptomyces sp. NPDC016845 TaxID=3364972 RepID=UPI0037ACF362
MRIRTLQRAAVLLVALVAVQGGASALADGKSPKPPAGPTVQSGRVDPLAPFSQSASALAKVAAPFVNAASDVMFPRT